MSMVLNNSRTSVMEKSGNFENQLTAIKENVEDIQNESDHSSIDISIDQ